MSERIQIKYIWDEKLALEASKSAYDYELKNSQKRFLGWLFIALTQFGVVLAMKQGTMGLLLLSTVLLLYWYMARWPIRKYFIKKSFNKSPLANSNFNILLQQDGLYINDNLIDWKNISEIVSSEKGFLLYLGSDFIYIPYSSFNSLEEKSNFKEKIRKKSETLMSNT